MTAHLLSTAPLAAAVLVAAIWQGTLLVFAVALCLRLLPRLSAAVRSLVWLATFVAALLLHLMPLLSRDPAGSAAHVFHADPRWSLALAASWMAFSGVRAMQLVASALHLRRIARTSTPVGTPPALALPRHAILCTSTAIDRPSVAGFFSPRILIPPTLLAALSPAELEQVLLHETEHLRRGDDWTNLLQKLALVVFPLNPALLWVERRLCLERELACDDRVLAATAARKAYARCLTGLAEHAALRRALNPALTLALGAWHRHSELARRVYRILGTPSASWSRPRTFAAAGALLAGVAAAAGTLAHAPLLVSFAPSMIAPIRAVAAAPVVSRDDWARVVAAKAVLPSSASLEGGPRWVETSAPSVRRSSHSSRMRLATHGAQRGGVLRSEVDRHPRSVAITYRSELTSPTLVYHVSRTVAWSNAGAADTASPTAANDTAATRQTSSNPPTPVLVPIFAYAAVPTANGWLIIRL